MNNTFMDRVSAIVAKNQPASMPMQAPESYPDQGMGALSNVVSGAPRQTEIMGQPHMLAYINPQEEQMLRNAGGAGLPGPDGVPAYWFHSSSGPSFSESVSNFSDKVSNFFNSASSTTPSPAPTPTVIPTGTTLKTGTVLNRGSDPVVFTPNDDGGFTGQNQSTVIDFGSDSDNAAAVDAAVAEAIDYTPSVSTPSVSTPSVTTPTTTALPDTVTIQPPPSGTNQNTGSQPVYLQPNTAGALPQETTLADVQQELNAAISKAQSASGSNEAADYWNDEIAQLAAQRDRIRDSGTESTGSLSDIKADLTLTGNDSGALNLLPLGNNTLGQTIINYLTPFGSKEYINGVLVDTDAGDFTSDPLAANNASGYVDPKAGAGSALLDSAYAKIAAGKTSDLTAKEQMALYGQRGTVPNAAETVALQENYKASGARTMTQDMQDEIVSGMVDNGATQAQIDAYKEGSPVGSDANPFYDTYGDLGVFGKIGKGVGDLFNYAVTNATYGLINPQKSNEAAADDFVRAYESEGSTGGQFDWNDPNALDISPGAEGDANFAKLEAMSSSETGIEPSLQGVVGEDGETVPGVVEVKNTKDGPVIVTGDDDILGGGDDNDSSGVTTVDPALLSQIWKRYYKGSGMEFLPPWMRKWASGEEIDLILTKVTVDGKEYYQTPDGQYIDPAELVGTIEMDVDETSTETETEE
jgi:hypothetical protein